MATTWAPTRRGAAGPVPTAAGAVGDVPHGERVVAERAVGVAFAPVDVGPRCRVHDEVGRERRDGAEHGVTVADVDLGRVDGDDVEAATVERPLQLGPELSPRAGDEDA